MWSIVVNTNGVEKVSKPRSYGAAFRLYERKAQTINAVNAKGAYLLPNVRISLRKVV
jgi:hypothetical protein